MKPATTSTTAITEPEIITVHHDSEQLSESNRSETKSSTMDNTSAMACLRTIQKVRNLCGSFINHNKVQLLVVVFIAANAIMMGIATFDFVDDNPSVYQAFDIVDNVFLSIFTAELALQLIYHGVYLFLDGWLVFDFTVIILSWSLSSLQIIRAFRIFRALRLITRIKTMKNLVLALFGVMPRMAAIGALLFLIFYIFAVMFTQLFGTLYKDAETSVDYFGRMDLSFFTLFQIMTLDDLAQVSREVMTARWWAWIPLLTFVIISAFVVVNLIIAVLCDAIAALKGEDKVRLVGVDDDAAHERGRGRHAREELALLEEKVEHLTLVQQKTLKALEVLMNHITKSRGYDNESTCTTS